MKAYKHSKQASGIAQTRKALGLSQQQLADELGVARTTVVMAEQNKRSLPTAAIIKLAEMEINRPAETAALNGDMSMLKNEATTAWDRACKEFLRKQKLCEYKLPELQEKLGKMIILCHKTDEWLKAIDKAAMAHENSWVKRQRLAAIRRLNKCDVPAQYLLQRRIELLKAEAELNQNTYRQCQDDYVNLFSNQ